MNIKFKYQYRDGTNYKNHNELIFSNKNRISIEEIKTRIVKRLISGEFFYCDQFNVPDLHFKKWNNEFDHLWHEFVDVEETTEEKAIDDINNFLNQIEQRIELNPQY